MKHNQWKYSQTQAIKNFKDIDRELERAELHQKFLREILDNDKALMKKAVSFPNLLQTGIMSLTNNKKEGDMSSDLLSNNIIFSIAKWLVSKIF